MNAKATKKKDASATPKTRKTKKAEVATPEIVAIETAIEETLIADEPTQEIPAEEPPANDAQTLPETPAPDLLTIEIPLDGFTPDKLDILHKLVDSKAVLIKKALGAENLPIQVGEDTIKFPWFPANPNNKPLDHDTINAYSQFVSALCETAKKKTRIVAQPQEAFENEKFAMRVFGIGLGLVGKEYHLCRKLLMQNLTGDSSWRYSKPEKDANGENITSRPRKEKIQRDVISIRLTPDTLNKLATLASQKDGRYSRNMLIEGIIEDYVKAEFPAQETPQGEAEPASLADVPTPAETPHETLDIAPKTE